MSESIEIKGLLDRLGRQMNAREQPDAQPKTRQALEPYKASGCWPGKAYTLVGNSYNAEYKIVGTEYEAQRQGCITLLFEKHGDGARCVAVKEAFAYEGFTEVLSRFERDWLTRVAEHTLLGPAYDVRGNRIRASFAVWSALPLEAMKEPELVSPGRHR